MDLFSLVSEIKNYGTITVEVEFLNLRLNERFKINLLFDTGASHTAICESILLKCGYKRKDRQQMVR